MLRRAKLSALLALIVFGAGWLAAEIKTTDAITLQVREIGKGLKCQCGCSYTVADCNMLYCHFRDPVNQEIETGIKAGLTPPQIVSKLMAEYGDVLRTAPKVEGFGAVGWAMPFAMLALGLLIAPFVVRRWRKNQIEQGPAVAIDEATIEAYEKEIERDLAKDS